MRPRDKDTPLVSGSSPNYARAMRARQQPPPSEAVAIGKLLDLLELELAHVLTCEAAADQRDDELASLLLASAKLARARAADLDKQIRELGGSPLVESEVNVQLLPNSEHDLVSAASVDQLRELIDRRTEHVAHAYRDALRSLELPECVRAELSALAGQVV